MTLFVDASALVAIIAEEEDRDDLLDRLAREREVLWSAMSCWETVSGLRHSRKFDAPVARREAEQAARDLELRLVPVGAAELRVALDAYERYGKGSGHSAKLNMGDCFAYACAKANNARLLYKGDDFTHTDLA
ncbi:type II toxin-antitoxin system VapC family toxin [uncultured Sphingomonas sp.]|uniref:type II toxin-antitoxin system VapC family toxin n=1 Tax=uncultured Sphingomonas sp. TaxID=158754 RepID=UPI0035CCA554